MDEFPFDDLDASVDPQTAARRYRALVEAVGDGVYELDADGTIRYVNDVLVQALDADRDALVGTHVSTFLSPADVERCRDEIRRQLETDDAETRSLRVTTSVGDGPTTPWELRLAVVYDDTGSFDGTIGIARDVSERERREAQLRRKNDRLERLHRINAVIREVGQVLVGATSREEVERAVCDRLASATPYRAVWIGERQPTGERVVVRSWSGDAVPLREALEVSTAESDPLLPAAAAATKGEVCVVEDVTEEPAFDPYADELRESGVRSVVSIPLVHREVQHGVLTIFAAEAGAVDERERAVLAELGETIGHSLTALQTTRALQAENVTELELSIDDADTIFPRLSLVSDGTVTFERAVEEDGDMRYVVVIEGTDLDGAIELLEKCDRVQDYRIVSRTSDQLTVAVASVGANALVAVTDCGAILRSARANEGVTRLVVDVPPSTEVRTVVDVLSSHFGSVDVIAQRSVDRTVAPHRRLRSVVDRRLTDRQRTALESAFEAGFFQWPRNATGEDLADAMGVAPSTYHRHLRIALRELLDAVLDPYDE